MRILLANKFYYRRGGDCIYMLNLEQLLKAHGHEVAVFAMDFPDNLDTPWKKYFPSNMSKLKAFTRPFGDGETRKKSTQLIEDFKPDVMHLNNIHTQLSPIIGEIAHQKGVRVVWTLHDYKLLCPRYDCLRDGDNCELCFTLTDGTDNTDARKSVKSVESVRDLKKNCLKYSCMKGGKLGSWIGYREAVKWNGVRLQDNTDVFICPSKFMATKMAQGGFDNKKLVPLCNFIDVDKCKFSLADSEEGAEINSYNKRKGEYYCFVGRLSHEKGVQTLIEAANQLPYKLVVIGGGPLMDECKAKAKDNIEFVGFKQWDEIKTLVGGARFSVIPSEWYENNPLSVIEAECLGTPVLGARIGGIPELIDEGKTGMTFTSKDVADLKDKIQKMWDTPFNYAEITEQSMQRYNAEKYYQDIMKIYEG